MFLSQKVKQHIKAQSLEMDWVNVFFVCSFMVVGLIGVPVYFIFQEFVWGPFVLALVLYWIGGLGITMGYHRLFAHKTYKTNAFVESVLLLIGTLALQNSALKWSSDHRKHHRFTDTEKDPYSAHLGFWWSHLLWIFYSEKREKNQRSSFTMDQGRLAQEFPNCLDLIRTRRIRIQHVWAIPAGLLLSFLIPAVFGMIFGHMWAYLLVAGFLRITVLHNSTFFINSLAHIWGKKNYKNNDSSKDSFWVALISLGEGYHNYHHAFPNDFRNGVRAYHFDPTKWVISGLSWLGLTWDLKRSTVP